MSYFNNKFSCLPWASHTVQCLIVTFTFIIGLSILSPLEAKKPKANICHINTETGTYKLLNISENAVPAHLRHGDSRAGEDGLDVDCAPITANVFVRVFRDVGEKNRVYDDGTDILFVEVVDANMNGIADGGDKLVIEIFPGDFDPNSDNFVTSSKTDHILTDADIKDIDGGFEFLGATETSEYFDLFRIYKARLAESYEEKHFSFTNQDNTSLLIDAYEIKDSILFLPRSPSEPGIITLIEQPINEQGEDPDGAWLQVEFYNIPE